MIKNPFCDSLHAEKYRGPNESFREACNRQANAMKDDEVHYRGFRDILLDMRFMPAGRIQAAMGAPKRVTPYNCYVSGTIEDSFVDGHGSIMERAREAAATMRMGGGIGYDFSTLRPSGALIRKLDSRSSGPISFMQIFDSVCRCVASSGHRRGAQMGMLRVDHPDIEAFVRAKQNGTNLTGFNISVAVTDEFMECVRDGRPFGLRWGGQDYGEVDARNLWDQIMRGTWDWAEPGVIFIDRINEMNNLWYCETIAATNPCGEQPLPPYGACLLGSFNLVKYLRWCGDCDMAPEEGGWQFAMDQLIDDIPHVVRAMDNVVDRAVYPLHEQEQEARSKRRMGLGVTGVANAIERLGHPYGSDGFLQVFREIMRTIRDHTYLASTELAEEKGAFPMYREDEYLEGRFVQTLPQRVLDAIRANGIRNSHLLSIAPTGTISLCADNVSSGIEPVFAFEYDRTVHTEDGERTVKVQDYGVARLGFHGKAAKDVTADEHVAVLTTAAQFVDSAVSKTCNVPPDMPWDDFTAVYMRAWEGGAKGCTTFNTGGKRFGVLATNEDGAASCKIDPKTGARDCGE